MKATTTLKKIGTGFREIHRLEPQLIPLTVLSSSLKPLSRLSISIFPPGSSIFSPPRGTGAH